MTYPDIDIFIKEYVALCDRIRNLDDLIGRLEFDPKCSIKTHISVLEDLWESVTKTQECLESFAYDEGIDLTKYQ